MDKKLSHTIVVLDALESYFESLTEYLKQTNPAKYDSLHKWIGESERYKLSFTKIVKRETQTDEDLFEIIHLFSSLSNLLKKIYTELDFKLPVGEEISKTRAYRLTDVFNNITTIYRLYIRDIANELHGFISTAAERMKTTDPLELQKFWQKWPRAIDLYTLLITRILNRTYADKQEALRTLIFEILDADKRFILQEQSWISPFLTFNCVPHSETLLPVTKATIARLTGSTAGKGVITINRVTPGNNKIHLLPTGVTWGPSITTSDIKPSLIAVQTTANWRWSIDIQDTKDTKEYCIIENFGDDQYRILVPWKIPRVWILRDSLIIKIKEHAFGRPIAYHSLLESSLLDTLSTRVANLVVDTARKTDVGLNILRVTSILMIEVKRLGKLTLESRLESETLDKIFETAIISELAPHVHLLDALLYWVEWTRRDFRKALDLSIVKNTSWLAQTTLDVPAEHKIQDILHSAVNGILKENKNIFQDLLDKQHKLTVVFSNTA